MMRPNIALMLVVAISFGLFGGSAASAFTVFGAEKVDCQKCDLDCIDRFDPKSGALVEEGGTRKEILVFDDTSQCGQNCDIVAYLYDGESCQQVLFGAGGAGFDFSASDSSPFPNIITHWLMSASEADYDTYVWYGNAYVHENELPPLERKRLNGKALKKFKEGKISEAISLWEEIDKLGVANSEIINNLGFAYFKLGKREEDPSHYIKAKGNLERALLMEPDRWSALLNLADLFYEVKKPKEAIRNYELMLKSKPSYRHSEKIKARILELKTQTKQNNS